MGKGCFLIAEPNARTLGLYPPINDGIARYRVKHAETKKPAKLRARLHLRGQIKLADTPNWYR